MSYELITVEQRGRVGVTRLNRPKQLNALSPELMAELGRALAVAERIAGYSLPLVMMIKESINRAYETSLAEGVLFERRVFQSRPALCRRAPQAG